MNLVEQAELVYQAFERCLDLDIAFAKVSVEDDDRQAILADAGFQARVQLKRFDVQEKLFTSLQDLAEFSPNDGVRLQAITRLGEMVYPKRFIKSTDAPDDLASVPTAIILKGADD